MVGATPNDDSAGEHNLWSCVLGSDAWELQISCRKNELVERSGIGRNSGQEALKGGLTRLLSLWFCSVAPGPQTFRFKVKKKDGKFGPIKTNQETLSGVPAVKVLIGLRAEVISASNLTPE